MLLGLVAVVARLQSESPKATPKALAAFNLNLFTPSDERSHCRHNYYDGEEEYYLGLPPDCAERLFLRGLAFHARLNLPKAEQCLIQASQKDPQNYSVFFHLAEVQGEMGKFQAGLDSINKALEIQPRLFQAYGDKSWLEQELGLVEESAQSWNLYSSYMPNEYFEFNHKAKILNRKKQYKDAWQTATMGLTLHPDAPLIGFHRAVAMNALGYYESALIDLDLTIGEGTHWAQRYRARVIARQALGRSTEDDLKMLKTLFEEDLP